MNKQSRGEKCSPNSDPLRELRKRAEEALRILANATDMARQAQLKAVQAAGTPNIIQTTQ